MSFFNDFSHYFHLNFQKKHLVMHVFLFLRSYRSKIYNQLLNKNTATCFDVPVISYKIVQNIFWLHTPLRCKQSCYVVAELEVLISAHHFIGMNSRFHNFHPFKQNLHTQKHFSFLCVYTNEVSLFLNVIFLSIKY